MYVATGVVLLFIFLLQILKFVTLKKKGKCDNGASCYSVTSNHLLLVAAKPLLRHFISKEIIRTNKYF